jgi:hypothetical protein
MANFAKIHLSVQKLLVGDTQRQTDTRTGRQAGDLINSLSFFEGRLKMNNGITRHPTHAVFCD